MAPCALCGHAKPCYKNRVQRLRYLVYELSAKTINSRADKVLVFYRKIEKMKKKFLRSNIFERRKTVSNGGI